MSDHHLIHAVERGDLTMQEAFALIKQGDDSQRCAYCGRLDAGLHCDDDHCREE